MMDPGSTARAAVPGRRRHRLVAAAAVTAAAVLAGGGIAVTAAGADTPTGGAHHHGQHVMHFKVVFSPQNVIDVPPLQRTEGDFLPGDYAVFSDVLTDGAGHRVGREGGSGLITRRTSTGAEVYFSLAIKLHDGQIAAQGLASIAPRKKLAIVGGTGRFADANGHLVLVENGDDTGSLTVTLR
jgi:Dirigent-like protein